MSSGAPPSIVIVALRRQSRCGFMWNEMAAPGASIAFHVNPQRLWGRSATIKIDGGAPLEIAQLTYP